MAPYRSHWGRNLEANLLVVGKWLSAPLAVRIADRTGRLAVAANGELGLRLYAAVKISRQLHNFGWAEISRLARSSG
jgi:hypothetical protein